MPATARVDFRVSQTTKALIERAAVLSGQSMTEFITAALARKARQVVRQHTQTVLSDRDRDIFLAMLDSQAKPNAALRRAARLYREAHGRRTA